MTDRIIEFVGGRQDGNKAPGGPPYDEGMEIRVPIMPRLTHLEVYVFRKDGKLHFDRIVPTPTSDKWAVPSVSPEPTRARSPLHWRRPSRTLAPAWIQPSSPPT